MQIGRLAAIGVMMWCAPWLGANAASEADAFDAAREAVIGFMAVCVLDQAVAVEIIDKAFDDMTTVPKAALPPGATAGLVLHSSVGTYEVTKNDRGTCMLSAGAVHVERLHESLFGAVQGTFSRKPHGRFCEIEPEHYRGFEKANKREYLVTDPLEGEARFIVEASVWDRVNPVGIQAIIAMTPTRRECPQS